MQCWTRDGRRSISSESFNRYQYRSRFPVAARAIFQDAELLFRSIDAGQVIGYVTATTLTDIFYISRKHTRSVDQARQAVSETLTAMVICPIDRAILELAFNSGWVDFEYAVQVFGAVSQGLDAILTRDNKGFLSSPVPVLSV